MMNQGKILKTSLNSWNRATFELNQVKNESLIKMNEWNHMIREFWNFQTHEEFYDKEWKNESIGELDFSQSMQKMNLFY